MPLIPNQRKSFPEFYTHLYAYIYIKAASPFRDGDTDTSVTGPVILQARFNFRKTLRVGKEEMIFYFERDIIIYFLERMK